MRSTGHPVAGVSVFQPGCDQSVTTDESGRFRIEDARPGRTFLLARKEGFRFHGQLIERLPRQERSSRRTGLLTRPDGSGEPSYMRKLPAGVITSNSQ